MAKIISVEWLQQTRELSCPFCSAQVLNVDGKPVKSLCSHHLFSWDGSLGDFVDYTDSVEQILDDPSEAYPEPTDELFVSKLPQSAILYQIETSDHACGPVVRTDVHAFDPLAA